MSEMGIDVSMEISPRESLADWAKLASDLEDRGVDRIWLIDSKMAMKDVYAGLDHSGHGHSPGAARPRGDEPAGPRFDCHRERDRRRRRDLRWPRPARSGGRRFGGQGTRSAPVKDRRAGGGTDPPSASCSGERKPFAVPPVRIHLAVSRPRMCRLAERVADRAIIMGYRADRPAARAAQLESNKGIADAFAPSLEAAGLSFVAPTSIGEDSAAALGDVRSWASAQARLFADVEDLPASLVAHRHQLFAAKAGYDYGEHLSTRAAHRRAPSTTS